jgi:hypothetical protein
LNALALFGARLLLIPLLAVKLAAAAMPISNWQTSRPPGLHHRDG